MLIWLHAQGIGTSPGDLPSQNFTHLKSTLAEASSHPFKTSLLSLAAFWVSAGSRKGHQDCFIRLSPIKPNLALQ